MHDYDEAASEGNRSACLLATAVVAVFILCASTLIYWFLR